MEYEYKVPIVRETSVPLTFDTSFKPDRAR